MLTYHDNLQFVQQIGSLQFNVDNEDCEEGYDDEDDLPAGGEAGHVKLAEIPDDDGHVAVESGADQDQDCRYYERALESFLLCVSLEENGAHGKTKFSFNINSRIGILEEAESPRRLRTS